MKTSTPQDTFTLKPTKWESIDQTLTLAKGETVTIQKGQISVKNAKQVVVGHIYFRSIDTITIQYS